MYDSPLSRLQYQGGRLGQKTGSGFYRYDDRRRPQQDASLDATLERSRAQSGLIAGIGSPISLSDEEIVEFVMLPVVNESCRVIAEGVVDKAADLDVACVAGMGFPRWRGGVVCWGDALGAAYVCERLRGLEARLRGAGLGGFFAPCAYLVGCAEGGRAMGAGLVASARL